MFGQRHVRLGPMVEAWLVEAMERYNEDVQRAIAGIDVWNSNCNGYYRTPSGRIVTQWPFSMSHFRNITEAGDDDETAFEVARR